MKRLLLLGLLASAPAIGQPSGALIGVITTPSGDAVRNTRLVLVDVHRGVRRQGVTDELGIYAFSLLPAGEYRLEPAAGGFLPMGPDTTLLKENEKHSWRLLWGSAEK